MTCQFLNLSFQFDIFAPILISLSLCIHLLALSFLEILFIVLSIIEFLLQKHNCCLQSFFIYLQFTQCLSFWINHNDSCLSSLNGISCILVLLCMFLRLIGAMKAYWLNLTFLNLDRAILEFVKANISTNTFG